MSGGVQCDQSTAESRRSRFESVNSGHHHTAFHEYRSDVLGVVAGAYSFLEII